MTGLTIIDDLLRLIPGSFSGLPSLLVLAIPFVIGLIIGYLIKKVIKIGIILAVLALVAAYFGFINLEASVQEAKNLTATYGPVAMSYLALFFGIVPLSIGLILGVILGFIIG